MAEPVAEVHNSVNFAATEISQLLTLIKRVAPLYLDVAQGLGGTGQRGN